MNYHGVLSQHVSEAYRPRVTQPELQERIARAALKNVPQAQQALDRVFTRDIQQPTIRKVETQTFYHGFDKPH